MDCRQVAGISFIACLFSSGKCGTGFDFVLFFNS